MLRRNKIEDLIKNGGPKDAMVKALIEKYEHLTTFNSNVIKLPMSDASTIMDKEGSLKSSESFVPSKFNKNIRRKSSINNHINCLFKSIKTVVEKPNLENNDKAIASSIAKKAKMPTLSNK